MGADRHRRNAQTNSYVYGLGLSGGLQGAGTIGGLLACTVAGGDDPGHCVAGFYAYDANGNVTDLVGTNDTALAHYEYDPFGNPVTATGPLAAANPFRFSTKFTDDETGLVYYGYRYYSPSLGRWINRDAIGEEGGENQYGFLANNQIVLVDALGLEYFSYNDYLDYQDEGAGSFGRLFDHWAGRGKTAVVLDFSRFDPGWTPSDFGDAFKGMVRDVCSKRASKRITIRRTYDTNTGPGQVDVRLSGELWSDGCTWTITGKITIDRNTFDFDKKPWGQRDPGGFPYIKEIAVGVVRNVVRWGVDYDIFFYGYRRVKEKGICSANNY